MTKDMTVGSPMKLIFDFTIPLTFGFLFQQVYSLVDTLIVGQCLGTDALAAVGSTGSINFLILGFCIGAANGFGIPLAQRFGAKDYSGMRAFIMNSVYLSIIFAVVMTSGTVLFCRQILEVMNTPSNIIDEAYLYIVIIFAGIPATFLYNLIATIVRSMGDSKTPVYFLVMSSAINIILDLVLILVFHMGVEGAAIATVASQLLSGVCCLLYSLRRYDILKVNQEEKRFRPDYISTLCCMGVPMGLQYSVTAIGSVVMQTAVNGLGSNAVASLTAAYKVTNLLACSTNALGTTMSTYGGQNVGAKKPERILQGAKAGAFIGVVYCIGACAILWLFGGAIVSCFISSAEPEIIANASLLLKINGLFFIPLMFINEIRYLIQGMGYSQLAICSGIMEMIARAVMGFFFVPTMGFIAVCFADPVAWIAADLFLFPAFYFVFKHTKKILGCA